MGGNRSIRSKPTTFGRALTTLFLHEDWVRVNVKMNLIEDPTQSLRGERRVVWPLHHRCPKCTYYYLLLTVSRNVPIINLAVSNKLKLTRPATIMNPKSQTWYKIWETQQIRSLTLASLTWNDPNSLLFSELFKIKCCKHGLGLLKNVSPIFHGTKLTLGQ